MTRRLRTRAAAVAAVVVFGVSGFVGARWYDSSDSAASRKAAAFREAVTMTLKELAAAREQQRKPLSSRVHATRAGAAEQLAQAHDFAARSISGLRPPPKQRTTTIKLKATLHKLARDFSSLAKSVRARRLRAADQALRQAATDEEEMLAAAREIQAP